MYRYRKLSEVHDGAEIMVGRECEHSEKHVRINTIKSNNIDGFPV